MSILKSEIIDIYDFRKISPFDFVEPFSMSEEEMKDEVQRYLMRNSTLVEAESVSADDIVVIDITSDVSKFCKQSLSLRVGKGLYSEEVENGILGMEKGGQRDLSLTGCTAHVVVKDIKRRVIPETTDENIMALGLEGISTLKDLRDSIYKKSFRDYIEDYSEAVAVELSNEAVNRSVFRLDEDDISMMNRESDAMAEDMLRASGLDPLSATDEEIIRATGRSREEHFSFMRGLGENELKTVLIGERMMEQEGIPFDEEGYRDSLKPLMEALGKTLEEAMKMVPFDKYLRQQAADHYFNAVEEYVKEQLGRREL